jgi:potassium-transporting ATPase KdpC subunit
MNRMTTRTLRPALVLLGVLSVITGLLYPLAVTGIAQLFFTRAAAGSVIARGGTPVASRLIGQSFTRPEYFWGRPSATTPYPYNGGASGGSNLGPLNPALSEAVRARVAALRAADPGNAAPVPVDLVTASGSGLDPEVSIAAIQYQIPRVARARNMSPEALRRLAARHVEGRLAGFLGEPRVNVVELNLDLDGATVAGR